MMGRLRDVPLLLLALPAGGAAWGQAGVRGGASARVAAPSPPRARLARASPALAATSGLRRPASEPRPAADTAWGLWFALPIFPFGTRVTSVREVVPGQVWTFDQLQGTLFVHVPVRMTVLKLKGGLLVYSPVAPTRECVRELRALEAEHGPVRHIVLPTLGIEHKVFAGPFARAFRGAQLWSLPGQYSFPLDLPLDWVGFAGTGVRTLPPSSAPSDWPGAEPCPWASEVEHACLGTLRSRDGAFGEAAFFHRASRTLLLVDSIVCVRRTPPEIMDADVDALLFHARDRGEDEVADSEQARRTGWARIALFALYFNPGGISVKSLGQALADAAKTPPSLKRLGWGGLYPWDWDAAAADASLSAIEGRPFVPPVLTELILDRQPAPVLQWARTVAKWPFTRIIPAHLNAPIDATPRQYLRAWDFLREDGRAAGLNALLPPPLRPVSPPPSDLKLLQEVSASLVEAGVTEPPKRKRKA